MTHSYDVIIVGAGPAGSMLAYDLAQNNIQTLIIDKEKLPRYKPCGGGLTKRTLDILPVDISDVVEDQSFIVKIFVRNEEVYSKSADVPFISMVMRDTFDYFLCEKAVSKGAVLKDETEFIRLDRSAGGLRVETSGGSFEAKYLIGADGVKSNVKHALGLNQGQKQMIGLASEILVHDPGVRETYEHTASFDFGVIPKGYGWIFPKRGQFSIGLLSVPQKIKGMKAYLDTYMKQKGLDSHSEVKVLKGGFIPYAPATTNRFATERGLLIGDSAGFTDPITGEGIFYALKGAQMASKIIKESLRQGDENLTPYNDAVKKELMHDLSFAHKLHTLLYTVPRLSYGLLKRYGSRLGEKYVEIILGEKTYEEIYHKMFSLQGLKALFSPGK
jgi:geranylgeranyl reductase family protein